MGKDDSLIKLYYRQYASSVQKYETLGEKLHPHDMYEIEFIAQGEGTHRLNSKEYPIKRGMMYAVRLRDFHEMEVTEKATIYRIQLPLKCISEKFAYWMLKSKTNIITELDEDLSCHIENLFKLLESRPRARLNDEIFVQDSLINVIATLFLGQVQKNPADVYETEEKKVDAVMLYLQDNFRNKLSIADVAAHFRMNPNYLNRILKEQKGLTLYAAIKKFRMEYAKKLLIETTLSITDVCKTCGYSGDANFLRDFKKETGMPPMKYRKSLRNGQQEN